MQIDHDPQELPRRALKYVAWATFAVTAVISVGFALGLRWVVDLLPDAAIFTLAGLVFGLGIGFKLGWWDADRRTNPSAKLVPWTGEGLKAFLAVLGTLIARAPFAVVTLPLASWRRARTDGDGLLSSIASLLTGLVLGAMATLACVAAIAVPLEIMLGI